MSVLGRLERQVGVLGLTDENLVYNWTLISSQF
jgi:hypothetical protein